ncbi:MAG: TetR family transcriptional regulator [Lachnospiraceae bacterium]|nr:TetR family transcriptional regulator [Lachnospiraceae bacterium]
MGDIMPPKPKYKKEEIVAAAYRLMKEKGIDGVVAREVGKCLGTTTAPIFTYFNGMDELKAEVYHMASTNCYEYLKESAEYFPAFKEFGMRWIRFAKENPRVYELLFLTGNEKMQVMGFINEDFEDLIKVMRGELERTFDIPGDEADRLIKDMCMYAQGIAAICVNGIGDFTEEEISESISRICLSRVLGYQFMNGAVEEEKMRGMMSHMKALPHKKQEN